MKRIDLGETEKELVEKVYSRADADVRALLNKLKFSVNEALEGVVRIKESSREQKDWEVVGSLYKKVRGHPQYLGWISLFVGYGKWAPKRLLGLIHPIGGRRELLERFADKFKFDLPSIKYEPWHKSEDGAIWFDRKLTRRVTVEDLQRDVARQATQLRKRVIPALIDIAEE